MDESKFSEARQDLARGVRRTPRRCASSPPGATSSERDAWVLPPPNLLFARARRSLTRRSPRKKMWTFQEACGEAPLQKNGSVVLGVSLGVPRCRLPVMWIAHGRDRIRSAAISLERRSSRPGIGPRFRCSGAAFGCGAECLGPDPIRQMEPGPAASALEPTSAPEMRSIARIPALRAHLRAQFPPGHG